MARLDVFHRQDEIRTVGQFLEAVRQERKGSPTGSVWFRGLSCVTYDLLPSIGRTQCFAGKEMLFDREVEWLLLHRFRRYSFALYRRILSEWESLFVARHHGLPVRLLDWTSDPLAALYFACEYSSEYTLSDARIWLLIPNKNRSLHLDILDGDEFPFNVKGIRMIYPVEVDARMNAQSSLFTIQDDPWTPMDLLDVNNLADADVDIQSLIVFSIPSHARADILKELNDLQVTRRTLYPDLDGLARGLISAVILRSRSDSPS